MLRAAIARSPSSARMSLAPLSIGKSNRAAMNQRERCSVGSVIVDSPIFVWVQVAQKILYQSTTSIPQEGLTDSIPARIIRPTAVSVHVCYNSVETNSSAGLLIAEAIV